MATSLAIFKSSKQQLPVLHQRDAGKRCPGFNLIKDNSGCQILLCSEFKLSDWLTAVT